MTKVIKISMCLFLSIFLTSCQWNIKVKDVKENSFSSIKIIGKGNIENRDLSISQNFHGIKVSRGWNVVLKKGNSYGVHAQLDANLYDHLNVHVDGGRLIIETVNYNQITKASSKKIIVTYNQNFTDLNASSAATINAEEALEGEKIHFYVSSSATITAPVAIRSISSEATTSGTINLKGITQHFEGDTSSSGDINASNLKSEDAQTDASSAGHISIYASKSIHADASSAGNIEYWGDPKEVNAPESTSGGSVVKK